MPFQLIWDDDDLSGSILEKDNSIENLYIVFVLSY